jgi:AcrR family transcriptional regulator
MKESGPRQRIENAALEQFYRRGIASTTAQDLMVASGVYKKSFYRYYPERSDLIRFYIIRQRELFLSMLDRLIERHYSFPEFWKAWMTLLKRKARGGAFRGCPFAAFAVQTVPGEYASELSEFARSWNDRLTSFLISCSLKREQARDFSESIMILFEGCLALHAITQDDRYLTRLEKDGLMQFQAFFGNVAPHITGPETPPER